MKYKHPLSYYTTAYNRDLSTIKRYSRANAPLDHPEQMKTFLAAKKDTGRAGKKAATKSPAALEDDEPAVNPNDLPGAAHTLTRLAEEELQARARLDAAKRKKDPEALKLATELYLKIAESLLRYDRQVDAARRDSGETVTRAEIEQPITALTVWLRRGIENFINEACLRIAECEKPQDVYSIVAAPLRESLGRAVAVACEDGKFPLWMRQAFEKGL